MNGPLNPPEENISVSTGIFGASVRISAPDTGMFLVIGRTVSPQKAVLSLGGEIVMVLSDRTLLVTLTFSDYVSLKASPEISRIGPITVDIERFNRTLASLTRNLANSH